MQQRHQQRKVSRSHIPLLDSNDPYFAEQRKRKMAIPVDFSLLMDRVLYGVGSIYRYGKRRKLQN